MNTKRTATITANDGSSKVKITIEFHPAKNLATCEANAALRGLIRNCADGIRGPIYTDFGAENTKVKIGGK